MITDFCIYALPQMTIYTKKKKKNYTQKELEEIKF